MSFAIDQIFCFAPSINPPIEPVVSSTKQTSMRDFLFSLGTSRAARDALAMSRLSNAVVIFIVWIRLVSDFVNRVAECDLEVLSEREPRVCLGKFLQEREIIFGIEFDLLTFCQAL